jgi:hypothetical protein
MAALLAAVKAAGSGADGQSRSSVNALRMSLGPGAVFVASMVEGLMWGLIW